MRHLHRLWVKAGRPQYRDRHYAGAVTSDPPQQQRRHRHHHGSPRGQRRPVVQPSTSRDEELDSPGDSGSPVSHTTPALAAAAKALSPTPSGSTDGETVVVLASPAGHSPLDSDAPVQPLSTAAPVDVPRRRGHAVDQAGHVEGAQGQLLQVAWDQVAQLEADKVEQAQQLHACQQQVGCLERDLRQRDQQLHACQQQVACLERDLRQREEQLQECQHQIGRLKQEVKDRRREGRWRRTVARHQSEMLAHQAALLGHDLHRRRSHRRGAQE